MTGRVVYSRQLMTWPQRSGHVISPAPGPAGGGQEEEGRPEVSTLLHPPYPPTTTTHSLWPPTAASPRGHDAKHRHATRGEFINCLQEK